MVYFKTLKPIKGPATIPFDSTKPALAITRKLRIRIKKKKIKYGIEDSTTPLNCNYYLLIWMSSSDPGATPGTSGPLFNMS